MIANLIETVYHAGEEIIKVYNSNDFDISIKEDNSPLTKADTVSNRIITEALNKIKIKNSYLPIISEESKNVPYEQRKTYASFWLVDPLDGTKEFIKRNGEFTVNIALVENNYPVFGIIYAPVLKKLYYGKRGEGCYRVVDKVKKQIEVRSPNNNSISVVKSRSHSSEKEEQFYSNFEISNVASVGSSLKFCMIAEGNSDLYFRSGPTMEWDTAAGQAIVENAGGIVTSNRERMRYNKESLRNDSFIVSSFEINHHI